MCTGGSTREGLGVLDHGTVSVSSWTFCQVPSPCRLLSQRCYGTNPDCPDGQAINAVESDAIYTKGFDGIGSADSFRLQDHGTSSMAALNYCQVPSPCRLLSQRCYGTNPDCPDGQAISAVESDAIYTEGFDGIGPGDSSRLEKEIDAAATDLGKEFETADLVSEFESELRPLLASNCLLVHYGIDDVRSAYLHGQIHGFTKQETLHLTSLDVMLRIKTSKEVQRIPLIDFLIKRRVLIHEEWQKTYGNVEILEYLFEESDSDFVRAECDASFDDSSKVAKLAIIIWKGKKILWAEVFDGVKSTSIHHAEVLAALAVLRKCLEFKFSKVKLWSDNQKAIGVINGSESIQVQDADRNTYLLLRSMHMKFSTLIAVRRHRELMFLVDQFLRLHGSSNSVVEDALKMHSLNLRGRPHFSVTHNSSTSKEIRGFGKKLDMKKKDSFIYKLESTYFCRVKKDKFEQLQGLRSALLPGSMELVRDVRKSLSPQVQEQVGRLFGAGNSVSKTSISFKGLAVPDPSQRLLVVVWDASVPRADYYQPDSCMVIFAEEDEIEAMKQSNITEINAEMILHMNRFVFKYK